MENRLRFSVWYFIAVLALLLFLNTYLVQEPTSEITYAQFKQLVDAGCLPADVLQQRESFPLPAERVAQAVKGLMDGDRVAASRSLAIILSHRQSALPGLRQGLVAPITVEEDGDAISLACLPGEAIILIDEGLGGGI